MKKMYNNPETEIAAIDAMSPLLLLPVSEDSTVDPETPPIPHAPTNRNVVIGE
ncbi:MAG: hypothetical protein IJ581_02230 [Paludibacteraceae bacterium]|nr:hypothetical protein [Paludibacteraceae bacterium]